MHISNFIPQFMKPREDHFFGLLRNSTRNLHETTTALLDFMEHYDDPSAKAAEIKRL